MWRFIALYCLLLISILAPRPIKAEEPPSGHVPKVPAGLAVSTLGSTGLLVSWNSVEYAESFSLYRASMADGTYVLVETIETPFYIDADLVPSCTYYYKIAANSSHGSSSQSAYASGTTLEIYPDFGGPPLLADELDEPKAIKDNSFLWGLSGFFLTFAPGAIGLSIGGQIGQDEVERNGNALEYGASGAAIGAGVSLLTSFIFSFRHGSFSVFDNHLKPAFYGALIGVGTLAVVAIAIYPEIVAYAFGIALLSIFGIIKI